MSPASGFTAGLAGSFRTIPVGMRILAQRGVLACLALATGGCPCSASSGAVVGAPPVAAAALYLRTEKLERGDRLAVIGDVQRTSLWGRLVLAESNLDEQRWLLSDLSKQQFRALVLLGDMVFSSSDDNWAYFDHLLAPLRFEQAPVVRERWFFPVMGNHEYMGDRARLAPQLGRRFGAFLERTHYSFEWHHVKMIVLDGNRSKLCERPGISSQSCASEWQAQLTWLRAELRQVDQAPSNEQYGALLFVHQSPYTQSPLVAGDQADARDFAHELFASQRGLGLISAHAHGFERYAFRRDAADLRPAKVFMVSAGGGGPRPHWRRPGAPPDLSKLPWPRPFNYLLLRQDSEAIQIEVRGLEKGQQLVVPLPDEHVTLPFR
jgi:hypothetical protein